jgi:signal transduction histidine kinase
VSDRGGNRRPPRILVVDDNDANRYAVARMLRAAGMETFEATSGHEAIERARDRADAIVLDVNLPDMSGFEVVRALRDDPRAAMIPIVHLSASYMRDESHAFGLENGANGFLTHPVDPTVLLATLRGLLRARRLEDERERLLAIAERARADAEEANRAKSEFLATMSHELRTPINAILGYTQILEMGIAGPVAAEQRTHLDRLRRSAAHLLSLVNELLDLAKVESGALRVELQQLRVSDVVEDALAIARPQALARGIGVSSDDGLARKSIVADPGRVRQIVVNLLSNAIKFSAPGGRVSLGASLVEDPPNEALRGARRYVALAVTDFGVGVPREKQAEIFEAFVQGESGPTRAWGGSGLGLTTSRRLARLMGGDITVDSAVGEGARFTLWLPAAADEALIETREHSASRRRNTPFDPTVLSQLGRVLAGEALSISHAVVLRVRTDRRFPPAGELSDGQLVDHTPAYVVDLGLALVTVADVGVEASTLLHDGHAIRTEIAARHGAQRRRLQWSEAQVALEYDVMVEEIERVLRARAGASDEQIDGAMGLVERLAEQGKTVSARGYREASEVDD